MNDIVPRNTLFRLLWKFQPRWMYDDLSDEDSVIQKRFRKWNLLASRTFEAANMSDYGNSFDLHYSARNGMAENCLKLLAKGADVNKTNAKGNTPLHFACSKADYACIKALLKYKADVNIKNDTFHTPLHFFVSCRPQNEELLKTLLDAGACPDISDGTGYSALHVLAEQEVTEKSAIFARLLLKYNANVNSQNSNYETPLHMAIVVGADDLVEVLLEYGASIDIIDEVGKTPMDLAYEYKSDFPKVFDRLAKHLIMQHCFGLSVNLGDLDKVCDVEGYSEFRKRCEEEIQRLKSTCLGESTVMYHDIFVLPARRLGRYLRNQNIMVTLQELDMNEYIYGSLLLKRFQEGLVYYNGINSGISAAQKLFPFLPRVCIDGIIEYLDIDDCSNLNEACTF